MISYLTIYHPFWGSHFAFPLLYFVTRAVTVAPDARCPLRQHHSGGWRFSFLKGQKLWKRSRRHRGADWFNEFTADFQVVIQTTIVIIFCCLRNVTYDKAMRKPRVKRGTPMAPWCLNFEKCPCVSDLAVHIQVCKERYRSFARWWMTLPLGEKKNMNLPGVKVDLPVLQESGGPGQVFAECSL